MKSFDHQQQLQIDQIKQHKPNKTLFHELYSNIMPEKAGKITCQKTLFARLPQRTVSIFERPLNYLMLGTLRCF